MYLILLCRLYNNTLILLKIVNKTYFIRICGILFIMPQTLICNAYLKTLHIFLVLRLQIFITLDWEENSMEWFGSPRNDCTNVPMLMVLCVSLLEKTSGLPVTLCICIFGNICFEVIYTILVLLVVSMLPTFNRPWISLLFPVP